MKRRTSGRQPRHGRAYRVGRTLPEGYIEADGLLVRIPAFHADEHAPEEEADNNYERESTPDVLEMMSGRER